MRPGSSSAGRARGGGFTAVGAASLALLAACTSPPTPSPTRCETDNGGCGDPALFECVAMDGGATRCRPVVDCARPGGASCDDGNPCTVDVCDLAKGCLNVPSDSSCDDGVACTADRCEATGCSHRQQCGCQSAADCDDGNPCTAETCTQGACSYTVSVGTSCSDLDACTSGDACRADGRCAGVLVSCDDGNPCTTDSCSRSSGCAHVDNTAACDDGNACTVGDTCLGGACDAGSPVVCNDNNPCTDDVCLPATGCRNSSNTVACDDGDACTQNDACGSGRCRGAPLSCNDLNGCTTDRCEPGQGCVFTFESAVCLCDPNTRRCGGTSVEVCNATGSSWLFAEACAQGCAAARCVGPCVLDAGRCEGNVPQRCIDGDAGTWAQAAPCSAGCLDGRCLADLVLDGGTTTLEGVQTYGDLVVVGPGATLRVGPSGVLELRAKTIRVDVGGHIDADSLGDNTQGEGYQSVVFCNPAQWGSPGSSYGTAGASVLVLCGTSGGFTASARPPYDTAPDVTVSKGSKWNTTLGGGLIRLVADSVIIDGTVSARGTGSASGGGVLVAARLSLSGSGTITTAGGAGTPAGGTGRIKLLSPLPTPTGFTGSTVGVLATGLLPPLEVSWSGPFSPALWYNDGASPWTWSWSRPFSPLWGYQVRVSAGAPATPGALIAGSSYVPDERFVTSTSGFTEGLSYLNVVPVAVGGQEGTLRASFPFNLNATPPVVTSASHPVQRQWDSSGNPGYTLLVSWQSPRGDASSTGSYIELDRLGDTVPLAQPGQFTAMRAALYPNLAPGPWAFHVVDRDTRNNPTVAARHYVVFLGPNPGTGTLTGTVRDGSVTPAVPLAGATVTINRGLFRPALPDATSTASGAYSFPVNAVPASSSFTPSQWEVRVTRTGYQPATRMVTVTPSTTSVVDFTLTR